MASECNCHIFFLPLIFHFIGRFGLKGLQEANLNLVLFNCLCSFPFIIIVNMNIIWACDRGRALLTVLVHLSLHPYTPGGHRPLPLCSFTRLWLMCAVLICFLSPEVYVMEWREEVMKSVLTTGTRVPLPPPTISITLSSWASLNSYPPWESYWCSRRNTCNRGRWFLLSWKESLRTMIFGYPMTKLGVGV